MTEELAETEVELPEAFFEPLRLTYEYVTGEHELLSELESPTVRRTDGIRVRIINDSTVEERFSVSIEREGNNVVSSTGELTLAAHRNWGLGFTPPDPDFHVVRIRTSSPFVLPVVQYMRPTSSGWQDLYVYRPADFATYERTRIIHRVIRRRLW